MLVRVLVLILVSFSWQVSANDTVNKVLDDFHQAAANANYKVYFSLFADDGIYMGTDASERWTKRQFQAYVKPYFLKGQGWLYTPKQRHITQTPSEKVVFFDELLENKNYGQCRGSGVLIKTPSGWKIQQYNLSIPVPNAIAKNVVKSIKQHQNK